MSETRELEHFARTAAARGKVLDLENQRRCEDSLLEFIGCMWPVVDPAEKFVTGWPLEAICDHLQAVTEGYIKRLIINVPPGSTKSTAMYMFTAWEWGPRNMPSMRYVCASYSDDLPERDTLKCKSVVESPRYRRLWGDRFGPHASLNSKRKFGNDHTGWRMATSPEGIGIGERGDRFILGDPNNQDVESSIVRKKVNLWFTEIVPSRLNNLKRKRDHSHSATLARRGLHGHGLGKGYGIHASVHSVGIRTKAVLQERFHNR
jgi:hypothetical protein